MVDLVRSELKASGVAEEAREKLVAGLQNAILKAEKEKRMEEDILAAPTLSAPGRNQMVSSKLAVKVSEGAAMRYVVATEDIKAGEVGKLLVVTLGNSLNLRWWWRRCQLLPPWCQTSSNHIAQTASGRPLQATHF